MGLLKWRDNPKGVKSYLRLFMEVDGEEIVKVRERTSVQLIRTVLFMVLKINFS